MILMREEAKTIYIAISKGPQITSDEERFKAYKNNGRYKGNINKSNNKLSLPHSDVIYIKIKLRIQ